MRKQLGALLLEATLLQGSVCTYDCCGWKRLSSTC